MDGRHNSLSIKFNLSRINPTVKCGLRAWLLQKMEKITIAIKCKGAGTLPLHLLNPLQGVLKVLSEENLKRFKKELMTDGFIEPISVWEDKEQNKIFILNGHQRRLALLDLKENGYIDEHGKKFKVVIPQIPVNFVEADSIHDAKKKILALASQYGSVSTQGLKSMLDDLGLSSDSIGERFNFPEVDLAAMMSGLDMNQIIGETIEINPLIFPKNDFADKNFEPGSEDEQGKLDQKKPVKCPNCGEEFVPK